MCVVVGRLVVGLMIASDQCAKGKKRGPITMTIGERKGSSQAMISQSLCPTARLTNENTVVR